MKNTGVIIKKPKPTDFFFGAETGITPEELNPSGDWSDFLPTKEWQLGTYFDRMACVTFSGLNCIETQINFMIASGLIPQVALKKLKDLGFFDENGKFNCSDRFTAKMSGTTKEGNTLTNVWDSIRKDGLVPEKMWPFLKDCKTWEEYYCEIPQEIKDFAKEILTILEFKYEWVYWGLCGDPDLDTIRKELKQAPLQVAAPTCPGWGSGSVIPCGTCKANHATMLFVITPTSIKDFDHYEPFIKDLALTYTLPYLLKGIVLVKKEPEPEPPLRHCFGVDLVFGQRSEEVKWLQKALKKFGFFKANETGYYWTITQQAVKDFQYSFKVANPIELWLVNGKRVGPKTRKKLNELFKD